MTTEIEKRASKLAKRLGEMGHGKAAHALGDCIGAYRKGRMDANGLEQNVILAERIADRIPPPADIATKPRIGRVEVRFAPKGPR